MHPVALVVAEAALEASEPVRQLGLGMFTIGGLRAVQETARLRV
jgi:hypothetical protein